LWYELEKASIDFASTLFEKENEEVVR
jgi:hypothetical protein